MKSNNMSMPKISFYILNSHSEQQRLLFVCKLAEKIYRQNETAYLLTNSDVQSRKLDDLLWTFRAGSFIPHQIYTGEPPDPANKILLGQRDAPEQWRNNLINLTLQPPPQYSRIQRLLEVIDQDETIKRSGRQRYRHYQQQSLHIDTHKV